MNSFLFKVALVFLAAYGIGRVIAYLLSASTGIG